VLGVGHQSDDVAALVAHPGDVVDRTVRIDLQVAKRHKAVALQPADGLGRCDVLALAVLERDDDLLARRESVRPGRSGALHAKALVSADERSVVVADQPAGQQTGLGEHLEAVADAEHRHPALRGVHDLDHDR
jgi:hypothetical protein